MSVTAPINLGITDLAHLIRRRELSVQEHVSACLDRIETANPHLNAFVHVDAEGALRAAKAADESIGRGGWLGPLHGIALAVKDNYLTAGLPTTACSRVLDGHVSGADATAVARLRAAGAIVIGKTNMHEWAYGGTNEVSVLGPARNPWHTAHITGGSSGGSGAALAARMVPAALGSDTGGSVRIPASACGVAGLKPTYGRVSRHGILPLSWSLDIGGPMARSAEDLALLFAAMAGADPNDPASAEPPTRAFRRSPERALRGLRIAVLSDDSLATAADVAACVRAALAALEGAGARLELASLPNLELGMAAWRTIMMAEAAAFHARYLETRHGAYAPGVRTQLEAGRLITAPQYLKAQQYRVEFNRAVHALFAFADVVALPTLPVTAPRIGQGRVVLCGREITSQHAMTYACWIANLSGLPAVSVPCGFGDDGMPVGITLMGRADGEMRLLMIADAFEAITEWHRRMPSA
jgi:aspartyl-tRNA(Asn)/glutamyl-tRNA(Gln) amidotransferase subunit A